MIDVPVVLRFAEARSGARVCDLQRVSHVREAQIAFGNRSCFASLGICTDIDVRPLLIHRFGVLRRLSLPALEHPQRAKRIPAAGETAGRPLRPLQACPRSILVRRVPVLRESGFAQEQSVEVMLPRFWSGGNGRSHRPHAVTTLAS